MKSTLWPRLSCYSAVQTKRRFAGHQGVVAPSATPSSLPPGQQYHSRTHPAWLLYSETKMISKSKNEPATGAAHSNAESQTPENCYMPPETQSSAKSATTASGVSSRTDATGADLLLRNWDALSARLLCSACTWDYDRQVSSLVEYTSSIQFTNGIISGRYLVPKRFELLVAVLTKKRIDVSYTASSANTDRQCNTTSQHPPINSIDPQKSLTSLSIISNCSAC